MEELCLMTTADPWLVLRLDGHKFSALTQQKFQKPFDLNFHHLMVATARALFDFNLSPLTYTASDEISVLLPPLKQRNFGGRLAKILSLNAARASSTFTLQGGFLGEFDCKIIKLTTETEVSHYFTARQANAQTNALNDALYWFFRQAGQPQNAHQHLLAQGSAARQQLLAELNLPPEFFPRWAAQGTLLSRQQLVKTGFNPVTKEPTQTWRTQVQLQDPAPLNPELTTLVNQAL